MTALATYLGDWCAGLRAADLPEAVAGAARRAVLDTLAVGIAGRSTRVGEEACRLAERRSDDRATRARAWLGARLTPDWAAFANATAAHALDFDDTCFAGTMHGSAVIFPAALAAAEARGASGADLLAAFVAGSEVAYALGATVGASLYDRGWWPTGLLCGAGAAAAVAKLAGSDGEGAARAIAFAALDASGCRALLGTDAKPLGVGLAARRGFESHWLAETGASVPLDLFEQPLGPLGLRSARRSIWQPRGRSASPGGCSIRAWW